MVKLAVLVPKIVVAVIPVQFVVMEFATALQNGVAIVVTVVFILRLVLVVLMVAVPTVISGDTKEIISLTNFVMVIVNIMLLAVLALPIVLPLVAKLAVAPLVPLLTAQLLLLPPSLLQVK